MTDCLERWGGLKQSKARYTCAGIWGQLAASVGARQLRAARVGGKRLKKGGVGGAARGRLFRVKTVS